MSVFDNSTWSALANNLKGQLVLTGDDLNPRAGTIFGDKLTQIQVTGNSISFVRNISAGYIQVYVGKAVPGGAGGGVDLFWTVMGMFTEIQSGQQSMPFMWAAGPLLIPG